MTEVPFRAAVVIPTINRKENLRAALLSAMAQTVPVELVVMDDGSTDGTAEMVRGEFPQVKFEQHKGPNGPSFLRNRGSEIATAPILFPIDDDSAFASPKTVEQTLAEFDDPRVGAVGIPFINVRVNQVVLQRAPRSPGIFAVHAYVGAAHALRRDLFLRLGGYRAQYFYMGEEGDYCIRMLEAGYVVRLGNADPIQHFESPSRSLFRADWYGRRNDVLFYWYNAPGLRLPAHIIGTTVLGVIFGFRVRRPWRMIKGLASGWFSIPGQWSARRPVSTKTFKLNRLLKDNPRTLEEIEPLLNHGQG
jgi:glycosyltransferase involved in cell wall biosynthesis